MISAAVLQRNALKVSRWVAVDERGAFEMADAAAMLREAAGLLEAVSGEVLRTFPQYTKKPALKRVVAKRAA